MGDQTEHLQEFFAVTETSVYCVRSEGQDGALASAVKLAIRGDSNLPLDSELVKGGEMLAITKVLQAFVPEKHGMLHPNTGFQKNISLVNISYWGGHTSDIIALFKTEEEALACFNSSELQPCDDRWINSTKLVLKAIGNEHPSFSVCSYKNLALISE